MGPVGKYAFIIARRELTKGIDLGGRVFLHSYDYREDPTNRLLEVLLTAPQVVAQWINMEHYFSTTDNEVYGSGSKVYHNVVGRLGIMSGPWSDLRLGLARQTVMNGKFPITSRCGCSLSSRLPASGSTSSSAGMRSPTLLPQ